MSSVRKFLFLLFIFGSGLAASGQSTLAGISGAVRDAQGALVPNATVVLRRQQSNTDRSVTTDAEGQYTALNLDPGTYTLRATAAGFAPANAENLRLDARQQLRYDVMLSIEGTATVTVNATDAGTINTEDASIAASLSPQAVLDLPANYRGAGSTSPLNVVQTLPGVQPDTATYPPQPSTHPAPSLKFSIQGGLPSQTETTVDGISAQNQTSNNIQGDAFPSAEAIAEIRVDGVNNNAEYGQPGEITTVTKSGTNHVHGSVYEYLQNQFLDATPFGSNVKPHKVANDFGASLAGPVVIPHLYNGHDKSFFFGDYEGLRYPQSNVLQAKVPTALMKQGNFSQETSMPLTNPFTGGTYAGNIVPVNASSAAFLQFYPDPSPQFANESLSDAITNTGYNYLSTRRDDIDSDQFDARVDQNFGQKAFAFARYTFKNVDQLQPADLTLPNSTAYAKYRIFASSLNYNFTPRLLNEFRFGFTLEDDGNTNPFNGPAFTTSTGLNGSNPAFFNGIPHLGFDASIQSIGSRLGYDEQSKIYQFVDNLTLQLGPHSIRFGTDIRHLNAHTEAGGSTPSINYGNFFFSNGAASATGQEFADFLVGVPYQTQTDNISQDNNGTTNAYAFYAEDNWKATPNLNVTFGLRYEFHPAFAATNGLTGNFDPSVPLSGRLIYQGGYANTLSSEELANVNACATTGVNNAFATNQVVNGAPCAPVVSNTQLGLPAGLRTSPKLRFEPRLGFSYRPFGNDRTAIRAGAGYYNITTTGALFYAIAQTLQSNFQTFTNTYSATGPTFSFPNTTPNGNTFTPSYGSVYFYSAIDTNWHDPYSLQTDVSVDHDFGHNIGARISYIGLHTWHLVWQPDFNQLPKSTTTLSTSQPRTAFPLPNFYAIADRSTSAQADYHSLQAEVSHRLSHGLSFNSAYTYAKNLSDNQGSYGSGAGQYGNGSGSFVDEQGGYNPTDSTNRHEDYGNVSATRRHRWISTAIWQLPVGRGRHFGTGMNRAADSIVGGWQLSNIFVMQSGTFLSATLPNYDIDPSGTGSGPIFGAAQRPDRVANGNSKAHDRNHWFNDNAFACPGQVGYASLAPTAATGQTPCTVGVGSAPIGRFGTERVGDLTGPGTISLSSGLSKTIDLLEGVRLRAEGTFTNVLNHTNLADPQLDISQSNFGQITQSRGSDFGGNRTGQLSLKLEF
ncbi:MAG: carboxypeptidase regulatory-like domain-containing protein [Janthinobacterium lividum]